MQNRKSSPPASINTTKMREEEAKDKKEALNERNSGKRRYSVFVGDKLMEEI